MIVSILGSIKRYETYASAFNVISSFLEAPDVRIQSTNDPGIYFILAMA
jgi:hypothetical protein